MSLGAVRSLVVTCIYASAVVLAVCCLGGATTSDDGSGVGHQLANDFVGKTLVQRHFAKGSKVEYDADGTLLRSAGLGPWTLYGFVHVTGIEFEGDHLRCKGERLFLIYDGRSAKMYDYFAHIESEEFKAAKKRAPNLKSFRNVEVAIRVPANASDSEIRSALDKVFATQDKLGELVPEVWRSYVTASAAERAAEQAKIAGQAAASRAELSIQDGVAYRAGEGASPPRVRYAPDPMYEDLAEKAKLQGVSVLQVRLSPQGLPTDIQIIRPLGMGLDEQAVEAVNRWKFAPGIKDGRAVAVQINIEVNFRLY